MSQSLNNTIHLAGAFRLTEHRTKASEAIYPGMLVSIDSSGLIVKHATAGGFGEKAFALEDALQGKIVTDVYADADLVPVAIEQSGSLVNALLLAGSNYTVGTQLISHGDGTLYPTTGTPKQIFAVVAKAKDLSASGAANALGRVRIL